MTGVGLHAAVVRALCEDLERRPWEWGVRVVLVVGVHVVIPHPRAHQQPKPGSERHVGLVGIEVFEGVRAIDVGGRLVRQSLQGMRAFEEPLKRLGGLQAVRTAF